MTPNLFQKSNFHKINKKQVSLSSGNVCEKRESTTSFEKLFPFDQLMQPLWRLTNYKKWFIHLYIYIFKSYCKYFNLIYLHLYILISFIYTSFSDLNIIIYI